MTPWEKLRYLGLIQTSRKYWHKARRTLGRIRRAPQRPPPDPTIHGRLSLLGQEFDLTHPDRWHYAPDTGRVWPLTYGPALALTGPAAAGDVKLVWELNRYQFLPAFDRQYPDQTRTLLRDWVRQNPFPFGVNWSSAMEVGLRLIAWCELFEQHPTWKPEFAPMLAQHARFIRRQLSSDWLPRNNHLIAETAALSVWDGQPHRWLQQAAGEQFYPSGVNCEQSVAYHHFVTHLFARAGLPQPRALAYLAAIRQPDGSLPMAGDNDDGHASTHPLPIPTGPRESVAFPDAGHYVIRHGDDYCFVRCGEFGLAPQAAHAHADLLSPIVWLHGQPILVDGGTFTYNGAAEQRRYFRSAAAHNVVTIDDLDQAEQTGTFAWKNPPRAICEEWTPHTLTGCLAAWRRRIEHVDHGFSIRDTVAGAGPHRLCWRFHLHPRWSQVRRDGTRFGWDQFVLDVAAPPNARLQVVDGWHSPSYNRREQNRVCEISLDATLPVTAEFRLR